LSAVVALLVMRGASSPDGGARVGRDVPAKPGNTSHPVRAGGSAGGMESEEPDDGKAMLPTRSRQRPVETELDRMRYERRRILDQMQILERAGLGERHPAKVKAADDLRKIDAEIIKAGKVPPLDP
jgi:hypothetical protein